MGEYSYYVNLDDKERPILLRSRKGTIEALHPGSKRKWEPSDYFDEMSPEEFSITFDKISAEDAFEYARKILKNAIGGETIA